MEIRFCFLLLKVLAFLSFACFSIAANAAEVKNQANNQVSTQANDAAGNREIIQQDPVIDPVVKRRRIKEADIDSENFELGIYLGLISIEDFGTSPIYSARFSYHITEDIFIEGTLGFSKADTTSFERVSGINLVAEDDRNYEFYEFAVGYNLFPGETFFGRSTAKNSAVYLIGGVGSTDFAGDDRFTIMIGGGYRLIVTDWFALHMTVRDHIFSIDVTAEDKNAHNIEISIGTTFFF